MVVILDMMQTFFLVLPHITLKLSIILMKSLELNTRISFTSAHSNLNCPDVAGLVDNVDSLMKKRLDKASADFEPQLTSTSGS